MSEQALATLPDHARIVRLQVENFKRIVAVDIVPGDRPVIQITGPNAAGKSTLLDAICAILGGGKWQPDEPLRQGARKGYGTLTLAGPDPTDPVLVITRKWTQKGTTLVAKQRSPLGDGELKLSRPQEVLDTFYARVALDPMILMTMSDKELRDELAEVVGLRETLDALDEKYARIYALRTKHNRTAKTATDMLAALPDVPPNTPNEPVDVAALVTTLADARMTNDRVAADYRELIRSREAVSKAEDALRVAQLALDAARDRLRATVDQVGTDDPDVVGKRMVALSPIEDRIREADAVNAAVRAKREWAKHEADRRTASTAADECTEQLDALEERKTAAIVEAEFPVAGLSLDAECALYRGVPLRQASAAEQAVVCTGIGLAMNRQFAAVILRNAAVLDTSSYATICDMAVAAGKQIWVEQVDEDGEIGFYMEAGAIVAVDGVDVPTAEAVTIPDTAMDGAHEPQAALADAAISVSSPNASPAAEQLELEAEVSSEPDTAFLCPSCHRPVDEPNAVCDACGDRMERETTDTDAAPPDGEPPA